MLLESQRRCVIAPPHNWLKWSLQMGQHWWGFEGVTQFTPIFLKSASPTLTNISGNTSTSIFPEFFTGFPLSSQCVHTQYTLLSYLQPNCYYAPALMSETKHKCWSSLLSHPRQKEIWENYSMFLRYILRLSVFDVWLRWHWQLKIDDSNQCRFEYWNVGINQMDCQNLWNEKYGWGYCVTIDFCRLRRCLVYENITNYIPWITGTLNIQMTFCSYFDAFSMLIPNADAGCYIYV